MGVFAVPLFARVAVNVVGVPACAEPAEKALTPRLAMVLLTTSEFEHAGETEVRPSFTVTEAVFVPEDAYDFCTLNVVPESASVPDQEYVYEPVPPVGAAVHVAELPV